MASWKRQGGRVGYVLEIFISQGAKRNKCTPLVPNLFSQRALDITAVQIALDDCRRGGAQSICSFVYTAFVGISSHFANRMSRCREGGWRGGEDMTAGVRGWEGDGWASDGQGATDDGGRWATDDGRRTPGGDRRQAATDDDGRRKMATTGNGRRTTDGRRPVASD